jgi:hypothetical protein
MWNRPPSDYSRTRPVTRLLLVAFVPMVAVARTPAATQAASRPATPSGFAVVADDVGIVAQADSSEPGKAG